jgi:hypothetical protein
MNHYYLLIMLINERQHQLLKEARTIRLANSRNKDDQPAKEPAATARRAPYFTYNAVVTGGSKV